MAVQTEPITPRFIRPVDWERQTGMSKWQAYRALKAGALKGVKVGGAWLIERTELEAFFDRSGKIAA